MTRVVVDAEFAIGEMVLHQGGVYEVEQMIARACALGVVISYDVRAPDGAVVTAQEHLLTAVLCVQCDLPIEARDVHAMWASRPALTGLAPARCHECQRGWDAQHARV